MTLRPVAPFLCLDGRMGRMTPKGREDGKQGCGGDTGAVSVGCGPLGRMGRIGRMFRACARARVLSGDERGGEVFHAKAGFILPILPILPVGEVRP